MMIARSGIRPDEVRFQGQHVLFVEGMGADAIDPTVLSELLGVNIRIAPLGSSFYVKSVAEALHPHHPAYYFLIDRDSHHDEDFVQECWENFPDPRTYNLLVWKRRELENYFLDPAYLTHSQYCCVSQDDLTAQVLRFAQQRLFLDVANCVIVAVREKLKHNWIKLFSNLNDFASKDAALAKLRCAPECQKHVDCVSEELTDEALEEKFHFYLNLMTGNQDNLSFGAGLWLHMIQGKPILSQLISSGSFKVQAQDGSSLQGKQKLHAVVKSLLRHDDSVQPADFVELKNLINARIKQGVTEEGRLA